MILAINRVDGGVSIMYMIKEDKVWKSLQSWKEIHVGEYVSHIEISENVIPTDRTFRNAWKLNNTYIDHDLTKAQEIKKNQFRTLRKPLLDSLDVEYMKALEQDHDVAPIITKKQELRDVTSLVLPTTIEELKTFLPECLNVN